MKGVFITFEGVDDAGKSTQVALLCDRLRALGKTVLATREPGGSKVGDELRKLVLNPENKLDGISETLLMSAARREHIVQKIHPALLRGEWVLCDRFSDSTFAYQGGGGVSKEYIRQVMREVEQDVQPDLTFYLTAQRKNRGAPDSSKTKDAFETRGAEFYDAVAAVYEQLAREQPQRIVPVAAFMPESSGDGDKTRRCKQEIADEIFNMVKQKFAKELP